MYSTDWSIPQRQSPKAIVILFLKSVVKLLKAFWIVILLLLFKPSGNPEKQEAFHLWMFWISSGISLLFVLSALVKFWFYRFSIQDESLQIQSGWWQRKHLSIPLKSIQSVQLEQDLWQRLLGVWRVSFDSIGSEQVDARIDALSKEKAEALKALLLQEQNLVPTHSPEEAPKAQYRLEMSDLLKLSLSANHLEAFFILLGLGMRLAQDLKNFTDQDTEGMLYGYAENIAQQGLSVWSFLFLFVAAVSVLLSAGRTLLKYYDFRLEEDPKNWKLAWGLTTRHQKIVPRSKIQMLSYHANWLRRKINFWIVEVQSVGMGNGKNQSLSKISLPFTSLAPVERLAAGYLPAAAVASEGGNIARVYWVRRSLLRALPIAVLVALLLYFWAGGYWPVLGLLLFGYGLGHFYVWQKNFRWLVSPQGLWLYSGVWGRRYTLLQWDKIQQINISQGRYQFLKVRADINFITAGGTEHIPYLTLRIALQLKEEVLYLIESRPAQWM